MKNYLLIFLLSCFLSISYSQTKKEDPSILQVLVGKIYQDLRDVATLSGVPYTASATWPKQIYIERGDTLVAIPFDSLESPRWNRFEYDIKIVYDKFTNDRTKYLQGIIVLERIDPIREEKLRNRMLEDLKKRQENHQ